jgi:hypothetical protein
MVNFGDELGWNAPTFFFQEIKNCPFFYFQAKKKKLVSSKKNIKVHRNGFCSLVSLLSG